MIVTPGITLDASDGMPLVDGKRPQNWSELGDALYDMAGVIDRNSRGNTLQRLGVTQRAALVDRLVAAVNGTAFAAESTLTEDQQTQLRASAAAVLSEVVGSLTAEESPAGRLLLERTLRAAAKLTRDESHPILRDSMVFGLYRHQTNLPPALRRVTQQLMREGPHLTPPYDRWLADGTIGVDMVIDGDAATLDGTIKDLERQGFTHVGRRNRSDLSPPLMRATLGNGDKQAVVEIRIRVKSDNIFDKINDNDVDIVWYAGHSSYGRRLTPSPHTGPMVHCDVSKKQSAWQARMPPLKPSWTQSTPPRLVPSHNV